MPEFRAPAAGMRLVKLDDVAVGEWVYDHTGAVIGQVGIHLEMNGNSAAKERRTIEAGSKFAYKRMGLYHMWRKKPVFIKEKKA